jgi:hypothetical protein
VVLSVPSETPIRVLASSFPLVMVLAPITCTRPTERIDCTTSKLRCEQPFNRVFGGRLA